MTATIPQVAARIRQHDPQRAELLVPFAAQLFQKAEETLLESFDADALYAIARESLTFLDAAGARMVAGEAVVELIDPDPPRQRGASDSMLLRLALTDRPFIVESVRSELRRHGVTVHHVLHPTLAVTRSAEGGMLHLAPRRAPLPEGAVGEALELWFLEHEEEPTRRAGLLAGVRRVLADLMLATDDFAAMRQRSRAVARELVQRSEHIAAAGERELAEELAEDAAFLAWLEEEHFIFLGYRGYTLADGGPALVAIPDSSLGVLRPAASHAQALPWRSDPRPAHPPLLVGKTAAESTVRRAVRMDEISILRFDAAGGVIGEHRLLGLFNTRAYTAPAAAVPIVRLKLRQVLDTDGALRGSHDYKQIVLTFDSLPRGDLFSADARALHRDIRAIMALEQERGVRLLLRPDPLSRGLSVTVRLPRDRFHAEVRRRIQHHLSAALAAQHVDYQLSLGEDEAHARLHFFITTDIRMGDVDPKRLEAEIAALARTWFDRLQAALTERHGGRVGKRLGARYRGAFEARYQADQDPEGAVAEVARVEAFLARRSERGAPAVLVDLSAIPGREVSELRILHAESGLVLSDLLPILEDLGFRVLQQAAYLVEVEGEALTLDLFSVQDHTAQPVAVAAHRDRIIEAAESILRGESEHDKLSRLVLAGGLRVREVALLRALQMYTVQLNAVTSRRFVNDTLVAHPGSARAIVELFASRFDPQRFAPGAEAARTAAEEAAFATFLETLGGVSSLPEDTVLRNLADLVRAMVRCDYYRGAPTIAFKIESARVSSMPSPRPLFEIGVASPTVEGVHLRGGRVARGGIRWSDRPDDFRTEVLGLMKTQMTKNVVIVPVGSKGGFVVKGAPSDREGLRAYVEAQYRNYVRALLGLTDNLVAGEIVPPAGLVIHDDPDPYLVVAADKGTATFSDTANAVAAEMGFWLGDAFASGGSVGYDHKGWGITARGAWAAVTRHFRDLGRDPLRDPFSAVGIGDMSGDVFGNGMRYSPKLRLLAAFDHRHIFIDPEPDPLRAAAERERLFALPRSSWADYDAALISAGGGVYPRGAKRIPLSPEAQRALGTTRAELSGAELVQAVLRAPVDLLWNGGIGTYVKASHELHSDVGDAANDSVRIDADQLRARIVGEGGNLGFTQRARIEFARAGGRIHTDAIDNSGGVDLSDHEVNLKLALAPLVAAGRLGGEARDTLLRSMATEVCDLVLRNNASQALALALAERRSRADVMLFDSQIAYLAHQGTLDPQVEHLPNRRAIDERARNGEGLTRPELAIVMAYVKMGVYRRLLETDLPDEPFFAPRYLEAYFPSALRQDYPEAMHQHPLRREIVATLMTGRVVDLLGLTFVHRGIRDTGATTFEVVRAALIALEVLDVAQFEAKVAAAVADGSVHGQAELDALEQLVSAVEGVVRWMLLNDLSGVEVGSFVTAYRGPLAQVRSELAELLPAPERRRHASAAKRHRKEGLTEALAHDVATLTYLPSAMAVVEVAHATEGGMASVGRHFFAIGERLRLGWLRDRLRELPAEDTWSKIAVNGLVMDLRQVQRDFTERYVRARSADPRLPLEAFLAQTPNVIHRYDAALARIVAEEALSLPAAGVVVRLLAQAR
jgi:glutamate dehydrogenase